jgi:tetratricopeptide (TPR) repeat protein
MQPAHEQSRRYAEAVAAVNRGDWSRAQQLSMYLMRELPSRPDVCFLAGISALYLQQAPLAISCLQRAVQLDPTRPDYMAQLARALATMSMTAEAAKVAKQALARSPTDAMTLDTLGVVFTQAAEYPSSAELFRRAIALEPRQASYRFNFATSLVFSGDIAQAEREVEACLALDPHYWKAYLTLSQLRKQTRAANHVERLQRALESCAGNAEGTMYVSLALGKELEDLGRYPEAFTAIANGKAAGRSPGYTPARDDALFDAIVRSFPGAVAASDGFRSNMPILVFGMPRSGTTLVERILSSHSRVRSAGELQDFGIALKRASGSRSPGLLDADTFANTANFDCKLIGADYIASTRGRADGRPHFVDKRPHNFLCAGHIANALPDAKLVCVRRDPVDTCLANFRQLLARNSAHYDYSFDLLDIGRYYLHFDRLMAFWRDAFPDRILEVRYEDLVAQQEAATRRMLEFCDLPWDADCLRFEENTAPVATASAVQVREPIYSTSVRRWRDYEPQLSGLLQLFDDAGIDYGGRRAQVIPDG